MSIAKIEVKQFTEFKEGFTVAVEESLPEVAHIFRVYSVARPRLRIKISSRDDDISRKITCSTYLSKLSVEFFSDFWVFFRFRQCGCIGCYND